MAKRKAAPLLGGLEEGDAAATLEYRVCKNVHFVTKSRPRVSKNTKKYYFDDFVYEISHRQS